MGEEDGFVDKKKPHKAKHSGVSKEKKNAKKSKDLPTDRTKNPKGFAITSARSAELRFRRKQDLSTKKTRECLQIIINRISLIYLINFRHSFGGSNS